MQKRDDGSAPLFVAILCWLLGSIYLFWSANLAWALKDGLGPGAVDSHGWLALTRFGAEIRKEVCLVVLPLLAVGCVCYWMDSRRSA